MFDPTLTAKATINNQLEDTTNAVTLTLYFGTAKVKEWHGLSTWQYHHDIDCQKNVDEFVADKLAKALRS